VPEAFMDPSGASKTMEHNIILLHLQCSGGLHGPSSDSNTMDNTMRLNKNIYNILEAFTGLPRASNTMDNNIISFYLNVPEVFAVPPSPQMQWNM